MGDRMKYFNSVIFFIFIAILTFINCSSREDVKIVSQKTGPLRTNCYFIYGPDSKEAALVDVGSTIDTLISFIEDNELTVEYIFVTHCHPDHIKGIPAIRKLYPDAELCFTKQEYDDMEYYEDWESIFSPQLIEAWKSDSVMLDLMTYDYDLLGEPDIYLTDSDIFGLGYNEVKILETPGHSRGSMSLSIGNNLITGDLIFYHSDGNMDCTLSSFDQIKNSFKRLYEEFPDETIIYPGHFRFTSIGDEKMKNRNVSQDKLL